MSMCIFVSISVLIDECMSVVANRQLLKEAVSEKQCANDCPSIES